jgi:hypothetical protein
MTFPGPDDLPDALITHALGLTAASAATELICAHRGWLADPGFGAPRVWWRLDSPQMLWSGWLLSSTVPPPGGTAGLIIFRFCFIEHLSSCAVHLPA